MLLQACLNGALTKANHPAVPLTPDELARDAVACVAAGAGSVHLHPRDDQGRESLNGSVVDVVVREVRDSCDVPVSVSTGEWIEPDLDRRVELIRRWSEPDLATVNFSEEGATHVAAALLDVGVGIEAGIWSVGDVECFVRSGLIDQVSRVLVEPVGPSPGDAEALVDGIHAALDRHEVAAPRLQHGDGEATWVLVRDALKRGIDTRIGFEDTFHTPDGERAESNAALVHAAAYLLAGRDDDV